MKDDSSLSSKMAITFFIICSFSISNLVAAEITKNKFSYFSENTDSLIEFENYPRCSSVPKKSKTNSYFNGSSFFKDQAPHDRFEYIIESAYINYYYVQFMEHILHFIYNYDEKDNNNPKFYFYHALELMKKNKLPEAQAYLKRFITLDIDSCFRTTCDQYDVEWLESRKDAITYKLAMYIDGIIDSMKSSSLDFDTIVESLDQLKQDNINEIGLIENIQCIFLKSFNETSDNYRNILDPDNNNLLTSSLDGFEDPKNLYFLSTQIELLVYKKFFMAQNILNDFVWDDSTMLEKTYPSHIKSFFLFFDLKRKLFNKSDKNLLKNIEYLVNEASKTPYPFPLMNQIYSLLEFYNDISEPDPVLEQSKLYLEIESNIQENKWKQIVTSIDGLNKIYEINNHKNLTSLDSAIIVLYQMMFINSELLQLIPKSSDDGSISIFDELDPFYTDRFKTFMRYKSYRLSFLANNEDQFSIRNELYYYYETKNNAPWKNIGYGFFCLNNINELRSLDSFVKPEISMPDGTDPLYNSFRIYKNLAENPLQFITSPKKNDH